MSLIQTYLKGFELFLDYHNLIDLHFTAATSGLNLLNKRSKCKENKILRNKFSDNQTTFVRKL